MKINLPPVSSTTEPAVHCSFRPTIMGFKRVQKIISYFDVVRGYRIALWDSFLGTTEPAVHCSFRPTIMGFKRVQKIISYFDVVRSYRIALWDSFLGTNFNPFPCATLQQPLTELIASLKHSHSAICENTDTVYKIRILFYFNCLHILAYYIY